MRSGHGGQGLHAFAVRRGRVAISEKWKSRKGIFYIAAVAGIDNKAECYIKHSESHIAMGRFDVAHDLIGKALKLMHFMGQGRLRLICQPGPAYQEKGNSQKALKAFQKAYDADRNFRSVDTEIKNYY